MSIIRAGFCTSALLAGFVLAGCSPGDIQFNGKVFDAINATGLVGAPSGQAKMAERQPLIVPPALDKLPPPAPLSRKIPFSRRDPGSG